MNRVYKVIWSKAKHCYVVTSEIARSVTKSASSARSAGRKGAAVLAMAALLFTAGGVLGEAANVTEIAVNERGNVITATKDVGEPTSITIDNVAHAKRAVKATKDGDGNVISTTYVKNDDAKVGAEVTYVNAANTVGQNLSALDKQVTKNTMAVVDVVTTVGELGERYTALAGEVKANAKDNLKVGDDGGISKVSNDGTTSSPVNKLVLNVDGNNRITMDGNGIKVGTNSTVIASDGVFAGGDTAADAKAALNANGSIKGADGDFTVDADGNVATKGGSIKTNGGVIQTGGGNINTQGGVLRTNGGNINAGNGLIRTTGTVKAGDVQTGTLKTAGNAEIGGTLKAGATTVDSLDADSGLIKTTGTVKAGKVKTGTLKTTGKATIDGALTVKGDTKMKGDLSVKGEFNSKTLSSKLDENNKTTINGGRTQSVNLKVDAVGTETQASASTFDENGSNAWAKDDESIGKSSMTADKISQSLSDKGDNPEKAASRVLSQNTNNKYEIADSVVDDNGNTNVSTQTASESSSVVSGKDGKNSYNSYITQNMKKILQKIEDGDGNVLTSTEQTETDITNEAKNKITNKALDVETDAASSIVSKVSNDYGSNTSTQLSHQTTEEMKAEGKTASYLRGAVEEKSQLIDGDKKTTIDTIAGQTNTNITEGKNVSNSLQEANQIASSVTDGTNTTVVNQDAESLASSITDGTGKVNNSFHWVDGSEQLIKVDDTHFYAETRTVKNTEETLVSGNTVINIVKDTTTVTVSSSVTDGATITGVTQTAKDITNTANNGTIANEAKDITNHASENMTNTVGGNLTTTVGGNETRTVEGTLTETVTGDVTEDYKANLNTTVGGEMNTTVTGNVTEDYKSDLDTTVGGNETRTVEGTLKETVTGNVTEDYKANLDTTVGGEMNTTVTGNVTEDYKSDLDTTVGGNETRTVEGTLTETVTGDVTEDYKANLTTTVTGDSSLSAENINNTANDALINEAVTITNKAHESVTTQIGNGTTVKSVMDVNGIANTASTGTITNYAVTITNTGVASVTNQVSDNKVLVDTNQVKSAFGDTIYTTWDADGITNITGNNTVISDNGGTTFANEDAKTPFAEGGKTGTRVNTKITGNKVETGKVLTDFAEVANNLDVKGSTTTGTLRVEKDGYVGGDLYVEGNIETHDAVLSADSRQVVTGRQLYQTNERVDRLDNRIKKVGANAAALAALRPGDFNPDDKFSIAAGFGSYRNANAAALGLFYRPNENVLLSLGTSFGDGENMVNAGVSVKFGRGKSMAERRKEMADEVSSMRDEMRSQDERIAELEEMLKKQSELIEKLSKES